MSDEVLESGDKGKSEEGVHFEQGDGSCEDDVAAVVVESDVREESVKGLTLASLLVMPLSPSIFYSIPPSIDIMPFRVQQSFVL